jgi:hypothetical protein
MCAVPSSGKDVHVRSALAGLDGKGGIPMAAYDSPVLTELGSVADFTRADELAIDYDGALFHRDVQTPTS